MLIDIASDIHTDLWQGGSASVNNFKGRNEGSDVLIIAGDTSNYIHELEHVLEQASKVYGYVLFTDGNHEHYFWGDDVDQLERHMFHIAKQFNNVSYLNGTNMVQIEDTAFLGCNGWYDFKVHENRFSINESIQAWRKMSNDPRMIDFGNTMPHIRAANQAKLITDQVRSLQHDDFDIVVFTHTIPNRILAQWSKYSFTADAILDGAYYNSQMAEALEADVNKKIKCWIYGHTHQRLDKNIGHIRFLNNARGYQVESRDMGRWFIAQIDTNNQGYTF